MNYSYAMCRSEKLWDDALFLKTIMLFLTKTCHNLDLFVFYLSLIDVYSLPFNWSKYITIDFVCSYNKKDIVLPKQHFLLMCVFYRVNCTLTCINLTNARTSTLCLYLIACYWIFVSLCCNCVFLFIVQFIANI